MDGWLTELDGDAPLVIYAPHGGRRSPDAERGASVNDLHTDSMALEIARRLAASAIVNRGLDRNVSDLNRISTLKTDVRGVLERLESAVALATHDGCRQAIVLLVHGWNISAPWCDVGVGLTESGGELRGRHPTVSRSAYENFCLPLIERLHAAGLGASTGHRYAASGGENVTQLFSGRHAGDDEPVVARLSRLAASGMIDGVQLELGIPLRWPGRYRDTFMETLCRLLDEEMRARAATAHEINTRNEWALPPRHIDRPTERSEHGYAVQAALADGSGLFLGAEPSGARSMAARLCLARPDGSMLLFVAEGPWAGDAGRYEVAGLRFAAAAAGAAPGFDADISYRGPVVRYATHRAFLDLERGLAGAEVQDVEVDLRYEHRGEGFGSLAGALRLGGELLEIDSTAVCSRGSRLDPAPRSRLRVYITEEPHGPAAFVAAPVGAEPAAIGLSDDGRRIAWNSAGDGSSGECAVLDGRVVARVPVYRTLPDGSAIRVTFGVAVFDVLDVIDGNASPSRGLFEQVEILGPAAAV